MCIYIYIYIFIDIIRASVYMHEASLWRLTVDRLPPPTAPAPAPVQNYPCVYYLYSLSSTI